MKFLLVAINAKYIHSNPAVYSLKAYGQAKAGPGETVEIAEYTINMRMEDILADIYQRKPDAAAFSCYIWNWRMVRELAAELAKVLPEVPVWLGGPEVSFGPEKVLQELPSVKGVMVGEGERTFAELLEYYGADGSKGLDKVTGIAYREGKELFRTKEREAADFSSLPFPYGNPQKFRNRIIYYESSRGCPFRCSYCLSSIDRNVRLRDMGKVKEELLFFLRHEVPQVKFVDRTFNCSRAHALEIWRFIHENDNGITNFHFEIAADLLQEEELELLGEMRPGLVQLEIGVQSVNEDTLREINRHTDMGKLREAVGRILCGKNVHVHLDLIAGLPREDYRSFGHSFDVVYAMGPHQLQLGFLKVLKGSPMYGKAGSYGINYTSLPPYEVLYSKWIAYEEICRLKRIEEMVELYYNSNQFTHTLPVVAQLFAGPFAMFENLADFYKEKGYFLNSPSRGYRYEALLEFACRYDGERKELYRELLTYDIYLRENMKSRPAFAKDLSEYRGRIKSFYEEEKHVRKLLPGYGQYQPRQIARMTHMEVFVYPVWDGGSGREWEGQKEPKLVLFDYAVRDPLTKEAAATVLDEGVYKRK